MLQGWDVLLLIRLKKKKRTFSKSEGIQALLPETVIKRMTVVSCATRYGEHQTADTRSEILLVSQSGGTIRILKSSPVMGM